MPQTKYFGFPVWGDDPPEGAIGKDLRDAILGEGSGSLVQILDSTLQEMLEAIENQEDARNKATYIDDGFEPNINDENYPTNRAVYDFVNRSVNAHEATVHIPLAEWDGDTANKFNIFGMYYKISDNASVPENILFDVAKKSGTETADILIKNASQDGKMTELSESLGITFYMFGNEPIIVVAEHAGVLPAELIEQMMGENPGVDIPYEAGTYVYFVQGDDLAVLFISRVSQVMSVKDYIDGKLDELKSLIQNNST